MQPSPQLILEQFNRGDWVAQSVKRLTLDFGSGHDPGVKGSALGSALTAGSLLGIPSLPLSLSLPLPHLRSLSK